jgi:serralysin
MSYVTLDYLPDLTPGTMANAGTLLFFSFPVPSVGWDYNAGVVGVDSNALLHDTYSFTAIAGATYDFFSTSYFDPFLLRVYDQFGNTVAANDEADDPPDFEWTDGGFYSQDVIYEWVAPYTGTFYVSGDWNQGSSFKSYSLQIYEDIDTARIIYGSNGADSIGGTDFGESIFAFASNDLLRGWGGDDHLDGGEGIDTAIYSGAPAQYTIARSGDAVYLSGPDGLDTLVDVERLQVGGFKIAIDVEGHGGQAYRLYQAAFNRTPDQGGLGYQMNALDTGLSLSQVAGNFIASPEFQFTYGALNNTQFVTQLYANVLHRAPDAGGLAFHVNNLNGGMARADVLVGFSESPENQAALIGVISNGMFYT